MDISEIEGISQTLARQLAKDNWTVSRLATIAPARLERYPGVGPAEAQRIVVGARAMVNRQGEMEARPRRRPIVYAETPPPGPQVVSVRLQRILDRQRKGEPLP